jgi:hypothetical protein
LQNPVGFAKVLAVFAPGAAKLRFLEKKRLKTRFFL